MQFLKVKYNLKTIQPITDNNCPLLLRMLVLKFLLEIRLELLAELVLGNLHSLTVY